MDSFGSLKLKWACGYEATPLHFVDQDTIMYSSGNTLNFVHTNGKHLTSVPNQGKGIGPIAVSRESKLIAYAEASLEPLIFILNYPQCNILYSLNGDVQLEYQCLAFSSNGQKLVSLSGVPDFKLTIWDLNNGIPICNKVVSRRRLGNVSMSFNPLNWKQLCLMSEDTLSLWSVESCDTQLLLTSIDIQLPEKTTPVGTLIQQSVCIDISKQLQLSIEGTGNMETVLYDTSYDERVRKIFPIVPVSHCWMPDGGGVYVGFRGGQIMLVESESGSAKMLVNPTGVQLQDDSTIMEEAEFTSMPRTGHAVLCEGLVDCLGLTPRGLITAGKDGHIYCFEVSNEFHIVDSYKLEHDIASMTCLDSLVVGTQQGCMYKLDMENFSQCSPITEHHSSSFVGIDVISPGTHHCITCREDGRVQVWDIASGQHLSSLHLKTKCTCLVCPISSHLAVVGTDSGCLLFLSLVSIEAPSLVHKQKLYHNPIRTIKADWCGRFLVTISRSSEERAVFICSARLDDGLQVLGYTDVAVCDAIQDVSILPLAWEEEAATQIAILSALNSTSAITLFQIPNKLVDNEGITELYEDSTNLFAHKAILKRQLLFPEPLLSMILAPDDSIFVVLERSKSLCKLSLARGNETVIETELNTLLKAHELPSSAYRLSFHQRWLLSIGQDGKVILRQTAKPEPMLDCVPHHYKSGGGTHSVLSTDGQSILTIGDSGTLTCWQWELTVQGRIKIRESVQFAQNKIQQLTTVIEKQNIVLADMTVFPLNKQSTTEQTWLEMAIEKANEAEDDKYAELKNQLRHEINTLRDKVLSMIAANEKLNDMDRLERSEFILDTEEHQRHQKEEEEKLAALREEIELANLAKMYLHDLIKRECWDSMAVKGKTVKGFQTRFEVTNYPLKKQSKATFDELEKIKTLRRIEIAERKVREEVLSSFKLATKTQHIPLDLGLEDEEEVKKDEMESEPHSLAGSRAAQYGASTDLLYDQFELVSPVTRTHEIVLLKECIRNIKESFNKEFDEVLRQKSVELSRIQEKNVRIRKIANDLKLNEEIIEPSLDSDEQPERLLTVTNEEIKVEKYISPEERKRQLEVAKEEEERKMQEMGDNWRDRGLDMMMEGRLEANAEEELFKDLPRPDYMAKDPTELTEEEIRMKHDFEKKEAAWLEEREKMKKALEAEMKKHQESIIQGMQTYNERMMKLFQLKVATEKTVLQEELKILRLTTALLVEEEIKLKTILTENYLQEQKSAKTLLSSTISDTKRQIEGHQGLYEQAVAEDKDLEKSFRKDFADCEPYVDQLFKLFRKRPRGHKLKSEVAGGEVPAVKSDNVPVPSSGSLNVKTSGVAAVGSGNWSVEEMMSELDVPTNMPEGIDLIQWERLVAARHSKVESERKVKEIAMKLAEMNSFLRRREEEDVLFQVDIQNKSAIFNKEHEDKAIFDINAEVQLLLKQGQVEIEESDFAPDFTNSVLIHRSGVEELNHQIKTLGEAKLSHMVECKDFKKGIRMLEWVLKRLNMEAEDLINKTKDIQMLRVTKELQERLMMDNIQSKDQHQIETLEKTIKLNRKIHKKRLRGFNRFHSSLKDDVEKKRMENSELDSELEEVNVEVVERQSIKDIAGILPAETDADDRMRDIVSRRRFVDLAKFQAKEIRTLREEVERLRMKTFPALVQVQNLI